MKRVLLFLLLTTSGFCFIVSCGDDGKNLVGHYTNGSKYVIIKKAGTEKYLLNYNLGNDTYNVFAEFKKGCFFVNTPKGDKELFCTIEKRLISFNNIEFSKKK